MLALGLVSVGVALVLLRLEAHLSTRHLIAVGAVLALLCSVTLLLVGATAGLLPVLAVSAGVCVASVGGVVLIGRNIRRSPRSPRA